MPFDGFIDMIDMIIYLKHFAYTQINKQWKKKRYCKMVKEICIFNNISK